MTRSSRKTARPVAFAADGHDHMSCIAEALQRAVALCESRGTQLTELRRRVLELVWSSHEPIGAYRILEQLDRPLPGQMRGKARRAAPPTVYRALDFLIEQGLVHRIESLNAFVGCDQPQATMRDNS